MLTDPLPSDVSVGFYVSARLRELDITHLFGLPGDFNLALIDEMLAVEGVEWVGTTNELNAAYAADGYARLRRGPAALVTTFGVGEMSAINGIAGSFAEGVPVIHIVGMPPGAARTAGSLLHHTLADGDYHHFVRAHAEVTETTVVVDAENAPRMIDRALVSAMTTSKPVYLGIPSDVAVARIPSLQLRRPLRPRASDRDQLDAFSSRLAEVLADAGDVRLLTGPLVHRRALEPIVQSIANHRDVFIATQGASRAILADSHPADLGVYGGTHTEDSRTRALIDDARPLILVGVVLSDFLTGFFTHQFSTDQCITLDLDSARIGQEIFYDVVLDDSLTALNRVVGARGLREPTAPATRTPSLESLGASETPVDDGALSHAAFWPRIQDWLRPHTTVIAEAGTAFYGSVNLPLPDDSELLGQPIWSSIGYTLPAMLGAMLATPDREAVLLIGDGSAQLTIQELATVLHRGLTPTVILLDNGGYTVERLIRSPDAPYQDVVPWDWVAVAIAFGFPPDRAVSVSTGAELDAALELADGSKPTFIRAVLPVLDSPPLLTRIAEGVR